MNALTAVAMVRRCFASILYRYNTLSYVSAAQKTRRKKHIFPPPSRSLAHASQHQQRALPPSLPPPMAKAKANLMSVLTLRFEAGLLLI